MRPALAATALLTIALAALPAQGVTLTTQVTGAGTGTSSAGGCEDTVAIAFHLAFGAGIESPVAFPGTACDGWSNAFVNDCRQEASGIVCDGSYFDEGLLTISHEGDFHYERLYQGQPFTVDGKVAFNEVVVPG